MAASTQMTVKIAEDGDRAQLTVKIADNQTPAQMTMKVAESGDRPQLTVKIWESGSRAQMTVILDGYSAGSAYAARVLALAPVAYYQLNGDASDSSGNAYDGAATGATFGATGIGDGNTAALFDGNGDEIDIHAMAAAFSGAAGTVLVWGKTTAWADNTARYLVRIAVNSANQVYIQKATTLNTLTFRRQASNASKIVSDASLAGPSAFFSACLTWDTTADAMKAYCNGAQVGSTQTGLASFVGTPAATTTAIGALGTGGQNSWDGSLAHVAIFDYALSDAEVLSLGVLS